MQSFFRGFFFYLPNQRATKRERAEKSSGRDGKRCGETVESKLRFSRLTMSVGERATGRRAPELAVPNGPAHVPYGRRPSSIEFRIRTRILIRIPSSPRRATYSESLSVSPPRSSVALSPTRAKLSVAAVGSAVSRPGYSWKLPLGLLEIAYP